MTDEIDEMVAVFMPAVTVYTPGRVTGPGAAGVGVGFGVGPASERTAAEGHSGGVP